MRVVRNYKETKVFPLETLLQRVTNSTQYHCI